RPPQPDRLWADFMKRPARRITERAGQRFVADKNEVIVLAVDLNETAHQACKVALIAGPLSAQRVPVNANPQGPSPASARTYRPPIRRRKATAPSANRARPDGSGATAMIIPEMGSKLSAPAKMGVWSI